MTTPWIYVRIYVTNPAGDECRERELVREALAAPDADVTTATRDLMRWAKRRGYWLSVGKHLDEIYERLGRGKAFKRVRDRSFDEIVNGIDSECS
jgi:hypothetical protein